MKSQGLEASRNNQTQIRRLRSKKKGQRTIEGTLFVKYKRRFIVYQKPLAILMHFCVSFCRKVQENSGFNEIV